MVLPELEVDQVRALEAASTWEVYRLAEEIGSIDVSASDGASRKRPSSLSRPHTLNGASISDIFIVVQGQVRLLCSQPNQTRETPVLLLKSGEAFGDERQWLTEPLPYRATAASGELTVLRLPRADYSRLLSSSLHERWCKAAREREVMIFFKTLTTLPSQSSRHMGQWISDVREIMIPAGGLVAQSIPAEAARCWLRAGELIGPFSAGQVPGRGDSWDPAATATNDWVATSDCRIYYLLSASLESCLSTQAVLPLSPSPAAAASEATLAKSVTGEAPTPTLKSIPEQPNSSEPRASDRGMFPKPIGRHLLDWLHRYPWVEQQSSSDCGAACLSMIARYWGKRFPLNVLRERANVGRSGVSLKGLAKAAEGLGFQARPVRASLSRLTDHRGPWIAHWEGSHFVVVYGIRGNQVILADPAIGRKQVSRSEFKQHWTGFALLVEPTQQLQDTEIHQASLGRYIQALSPYRSLIVQIILVSLLIQVFGLVSPLFTQIILDRVVVQKSLSTLNLFAIGLVLFSFWSICLSSVRQYLLSYFSNRLDLTLISGFISHTMLLPLRFFESRRVGDIITRVQENQKIQRFLIGQVVLAWLNFLTGFVYLGLMLYYNWQLTLLVLCLIPPIALLTLGSTPFLRKLSRELFKEAADQNSTLVEMMNGIATVKSASAERDLRWLWEDRLTRQMNVRFRGQQLGIGLGATNGLINSIGGAVLLWYGASLVIQDQLTIGQFVAFNMMMGYVISPVLALANLWDELQEVLISVERLNDVFEAELEESPQHPMLVLPSLIGEVVFEDVTFRYGQDEERNTLQNLSFQVQPGQTVAIVGRSGSGKTTLVKLLEALYYPVQGRIFVDGHDSRHVSPQSLRSQLGVVPQECFLFSGTILENITLFRPEFTLDDAVDAAKLAEAHTFIQALPLGYNTKVGERGSTLSGGQRQRIAIARALLGHPKILILDEATSSLDTESERRFQQNLAQISRDRTTFIIAHRLSTVRNADQILVLDRGVLVEQGTHSELMAQSGLYCHLAQQQLDL
ncbi:peptidase C39 [filamentous cyanobacterium CCP5]|nr:peptidase C39 [filamentous cyanobacterium CCP5]